MTLRQIQNHQRRRNRHPDVLDPLWTIVDRKESFALVYGFVVVLVLVVVLGCWVFEDEGDDEQDGPGYQASEPLVSPLCGSTREFFSRFGDGLRARSASEGQPRDDPRWRFGLPVSRDIRGEAPG